MCGVLYAKSFTFILHLIYTQLILIITSEGGKTFQVRKLRLREFKGLAWGVQEMFARLNCNDSGCPLGMKSITLPIFFFLSWVIRLLKMFRNPSPMLLLGNSIISCRRQAPTIEEDQTSSGKSCAGPWQFSPACLSRTAQQASSLAARYTLWTAAGSHPRRYSLGLSQVILYENVWQIALKFILLQSAM